MELICKMSIINNEKLKEKTKEVAIQIGTDLKESNKTSKIVMAVLLVLFLSTAAMAYKMYTYNVELEALKAENIQIKNRMKELDDKIVQNYFEYLEIENKVNLIDKDLKVKLEKAKEVVVHEVETSHDIISVLNDLSDLTTGK